MIDERELDRLLDAFLGDGANELADRVIDAALDQIDHTAQRRVMRVPRRFHAMPLLTRVAAAAAIGVVAVGGALVLLKPGQPAVGGPVPAVIGTATPASPAAPSPTTQGAPAGPLGDGRRMQTQTSLADGRVLVAGGYDSRDAVLASAVLFDPTTGTFSPTGSMAAARGLDTATLLADGRILVAGGGHESWTGVQGAPFLASAELYDPKTGTFSPTGSMATPREDHTATRLLDGRVLVVGGDDTTGHGVASAELYDPASGTFSATGSMSTARGFHTATLLADGRVLVAGGDDAAWSSGPFQASAELYDPRSGTFSPTGSMGVGRVDHTATLLSNGRVLVTGGTQDGTDLASAELYDPTTGTFTRTGSMTTGRFYHTATLLPDGRVLVAGGEEDYTHQHYLASAEIYDPKTSTFVATGSMAEARSWDKAGLLADGRVLVTGGDGALAPLATAEIFDPGTGTFSASGSGR